MEEIISFLLFTEYKDETILGSDIPLRWFMDVIVICLFIFMFVLIYKFVAAIIRYSFYRMFEHHKYKDVLNEAVVVSQTLLELCGGDNTEDTCCENQWYSTISKAYMALGRIENIYNKTNFYCKNKKRIGNIYHSLNAELKKCESSKDSERNIQSVAVSLRNVNKAIVDYLK